MSFPVNFDAVTNDRAKLIQDSFERKKKGKPSKAEQEANEAQKAFKVSERELKAIESMGKKAAPVAPKEQERRAEAVIKQKVRLVAKIDDYKKFFPNKFAKIKTPSPDASMDQIKAVLQGMRDVLASDGAEAQIRQALPLVGVGLETVTMKFGLNPVGWDLTGFGMMLASEEAQQALEPESTELVVEYKEYLMAPAYMRFMTKVGVLANAYSTGRQAQSQVSESLRAQYSDLAPEASSSPDKQ